MPAPNNPATARVALAVIRDVRKFINTFHVARSDNAELSDSDLVAINNVFADWWLNSYRHACTNVIVGESVVSTKQDPTDPIQETAFLAAPGDYAGANPTPGDVTAAVSWRTGLAGRKYRGRFYDFEVPDNAFNNSDIISGAYILLLSSIANYLLAHLATAALKLVIFHREDNTYTAVTGDVVDQLLDGMRTRLQGRGV